MTDHKFDYIIIGAGIFGMYAAKVLGDKGYRVALLEYEKEPFLRASYINQARLHRGYHYPRSHSTVTKVIEYYDRFLKYFSFSIRKRYKSIYAISNKNSLVSSKQFQDFCSYFNIPFKEIDPQSYFRKNKIESAFKTVEHIFDGLKIRDYFINSISGKKNISIFFNIRMDKIENSGENYIIRVIEGRRFSAPVVLNTTYASTNQILKKFGFKGFKIKYELCEIILCHVNRVIKNTGFTIMDGPFFSLVPFGLNDIYSLSAVNFTPHLISEGNLPIFSCQEMNQQCSPQQLENCNFCLSKPQTAWGLMSKLMRNYLQPSIQIKYDKSQFAIKPILIDSETDDSRPTLIKIFSKSPTFITILPGKISTIYDLDELLT